jgi:hypothetical protein
MNYEEILQTDYIHRSQVDSHIERFTNHKNHQLAELIRLVEKLFKVRAIWNPIQGSFYMETNSGQILEPATDKGRRLLEGVGNTGRRRAIQALKAEENTNPNARRKHS